MKVRLDFETIVREEFAPLLDQYGYRVVKADKSIVRFDSSKLMITVQYDFRRSFEVCVNFSELEGGNSRRRVPFNLGDIFREFSVPKAEEFSFFQSSDLSQLRKFLSIAMNNLELYCEPIMLGDSDAFLAVGTRRSRESIEYTQQLEIRSARAKADAAWHGKRFQEFVELLKPLEAGLSVAERKKLVYAKKMLNE